MSDFFTILAPLSVVIWIYLLFFRGGFWRNKPAIEDAALNPGGADWPPVAVIVPARNEADVIGRTARALLAQDYPGALSILIIDDESTDATAAEAEAAAASFSSPERTLRVLRGQRLEQGWTGKMWAVHQGTEAVQHLRLSPRYLLLTDADIEHAPQSLRFLVQRAERAGLALVSLMARLPTRTLAEKIIVPAYIYFFQKLYPFAWVNDPKRRIAAAAGGCMLVRWQALRRIGGIPALKNALIDDCTLGRLIKRVGSVWLGLSGDLAQEKGGAPHVASLRGYPSWRDLWMLIARSAFTQLHYSAPLLVLAIFGMFVTYIYPVMALLAADPVVRGFGLLGWVMMTISYLPMLAYHRQSPFWAPVLPLVALFYSLATIDSARRYWLGRGGAWKGRVQAALPTRSQQ